MDVGCGAGPSSAALVEAGFEVTGIDSSAELLTIARATVSRAHFIHGLVYETQIPACEAIVALGEPPTYRAKGANKRERERESLWRRGRNHPGDGLLNQHSIMFQSCPRGTVKFNCGFLVDRHGGNQLEFGYRKIALG